MLDYRGCGMSVNEMSHRSKMFQDIIDDAEADLRDLMGIPANYKVLFLQGGAHQQFAAIPLNLCNLPGASRKADYINTGQWSKKALAEAKRFIDAQEIASSADKTFSYIPDCSDLPVRDDADYVYICENNTIYGTVFHELPNTKGKILVSDVSSMFLSSPLTSPSTASSTAACRRTLVPQALPSSWCARTSSPRATLPTCPS
jgi:phosphoserine aminotransferase